MRHNLFVILEDKLYQQFRLSYIIDNENEVQEAVYSDIHLWPILAYYQKSTSIWIEYKRHMNNNPDIHAKWYKLVIKISTRPLVSLTYVST